MKNATKSRLLRVQLNMLIEQISSDIVIDTAYQWLCQQRKNDSHNNDIWSLRWYWTTIKPDIQQRLRAGEYQFGPLTEYRFPDQIVQVWQAADALVLKALTLVLTQYWAPVLSKRCFHLKGHGGLKAAVRETYAHLQTVPQQLSESEFSE